MTEQYIELPDQTNDDPFSEVYEEQWEGFFGEPPIDWNEPAPIYVSKPVVQAEPVADTLGVTEAETNGLFAPDFVPPPKVAPAVQTSSKTDEKTSKPSPTKRLDIASALTTPPKPRDFALPCLRIGTVGGLVSPGGAGKSMLSMQLALTVATGIDAIPGLLTLPSWQNLKTGPVMYASFEDGEEDAAARLHSIWTAAGRSASSNAIAIAAQNLAVDTLTGISPPDLIDDPEWESWLDAACKNRRLVILDTLRMAHMEDENDSSAMSRLLGKMQASALRNQCAILFLHHTSKAAATNNQGSQQQAARGSSVITDNARGQFYLSGMSESETTCDGMSWFDSSAPGALAKITLNELDPEGRPMRSRYARFGVAKSNYAQPWPEVWLRRNERGVLSCAQLVPRSNSTTTNKQASTSKSSKETVVGRRA